MGHDNAAISTVFMNEVGSGVGGTIPKVPEQLGTFGALGSKMDIAQAVGKLVFLETELGYR